MILLLKILKKRRLLAKYKQTNKKMLDQIHLHKLMSDDPEFQAYLRHIIFCEIRCYNRIKNLK